MRIARAHRGGWAAPALSEGLAAELEMIYVVDTI